MPLNLIKDTLLSMSLWDKLWDKRQKTNDKRADSTSSPRSPDLHGANLVARPEPGAPLTEARRTSASDRTDATGVKQEIRAPSQTITPQLHADKAFLV